MQEAAKKMSGSTKEIEKFLQKDDKRKREYSRRFTGHEWTDPSGYDLCLDTSILGYEGCIAEIEKAYRELQEK